MALVLLAVVSAVMLVAASVRPPVTQPVMSPALSSPDGSEWPHESPVPPPVGTTRFVSMDGSDASDGTPVHPMRTIQAAVNASEAGDAVVVHAGTYAPFVVSVPGRRSAPFVVESAPHETVTVRGQPSVPSTIRITGTASWVTLAGLTVTGTSGYRSAGILVESIRSGGTITLRDMTVTQNAGFGIHIYASHNVTVEGSDISHNGTGVQVTDDGEGVVINDNDIHENDRMIRDTVSPTNDDYGAEAVSFDGTTGHVVATNNRIWGNRAPSHDYVWDGGAFSIFGASNVLIGWNTVWDNENVLETGTSGSPCANDQFVRNEAWGATSQGRSWGIFLRCGQDLLIAQNTIVDLDAFILSVDDDSSSFASSIAGARILNNILVMRNGGKVFGFPARGALPDDLTIDYDLVWAPYSLVATLEDGPWVTSLSELTELRGFEAHGIQADPQFANDAVGEYELSPDLPAIDRATALPEVQGSISGAGPDMGRWEYVAASVSPSPSGSSQ